MTLTIEAGVTINLFDHLIRVNGDLIAKGTSESRISFVSNESWALDAHIEFSGSAGSSLENCDLFNVIVVINGCSPNLNNNTFHGIVYLSSMAQLIVYGGAPSVSNNIFTDNIRHMKEFAMCGKAIKIEGSSRLTLVNNTIEQNGYGLYIHSSSTSTGTLLVRNNLITTSFYTGLIFDSVNPGIIENNTITDNTEGIEIGACPDGTILANNNIYGNRYLDGSQHNIALTQAHLPWQATHINATYNWWGTTDSQAINQSMNTVDNGINVGSVDFIPCLTALNPQALPNPTGATPIPTPISTPVAPEFPTLAIIGLIIVPISIATTLMTKKFRNSR